MYTLLKPIQVRERLLEKKIRIFTAQDFIRIFGSSVDATKYFLEHQVGEGLLMRIKKGLYMLKTDMPTEEEIANAFYKPSYISFEYALAYYNIIPEMPYTVTSATPKPTRLFTTQSTSFSYRSIKQEAFTGYFLEKKEDRSFLIACPEKALCDYLYFVSLRKSSHNDRLITKLREIGWNKTKLLEYARLFQRESLMDLISTLLP